MRVLHDPLLVGGDEGVSMVESPTEYSFADRYAISGWFKWIFDLLVL